MKRIVLLFVNHTMNIIINFPKVLKILKEKGVKALIFAGVNYLKNIIGELKNQSITQYTINNNYRHFNKEAIVSNNNIKSNILISVVVPVYNVETRLLDSCINSVINQIYKNWELIIYDDGSTNNEIIKYLNNISNKKIKVYYGKINNGISYATNYCISKSTGSYIALLDNDDELTNNALLEVVKSLYKNSKIDYLYSDEDKIIEDENGVLEYTNPFCKPDWDPHLIFSFMYTGHLSVYRKSIIQKVGGFRSEYDYSQDYDLLLRVSEITKNIHHISKVLYHWRVIPSSSSGGGKSFARKTNISALCSMVKRRNYKAMVEEYSYANRVKFSLFETPLVSIIIPSDSQINIIKCIKSIKKNTNYDNYEIIVVTNTNIISNIIDNSVIFIQFNEEYNFSRKCNIGASNANGSYLLFLNDDVYPIKENKDWLINLIRIFAKNEVGGVSPKLVYPDNTIQYAGMVTNVPGVIGTAFHKLHSDTTIYNNIVQSERNTQILSGACFLIKKEIFNKIEGFDEYTFPIMHSDVDLSFKLLECNYELIYTPFSKLVHVGNHSIKHINKKSNDLLLIKKWYKYLINDPYYTENMRSLLHNKTMTNYKIMVSNNSKNNNSNRDVLLCSHDLSNSGAPILLYNFAGYLVNKGFNVYLISPIDGPLSEKLLDIGVNVIIDNTIYWGCNTHLFDDFEFIVVNTIVIYNIVNYCEKRKIPVYWIIHESKFGYDLALNNREVQNALFAAKIVIFHHEETINKYVNYFKLSNAKLITLGTNPIKTRNNKRNYNVVNIVHIGSVEPRKGQDVLVDAFLSLSGEIKKKVVITFVGRVLDDDYYIIQKNKTKLFNNVVWVGNVPYEKMNKYYNNSDIYICTSRDETGPLTVLEAMSCGKAIISTDVGSVNIMIDDKKNGLVINNEDISKLKDNIEFLVYNPKIIKEYGLKAKRIYNDNFTAENYSKQILELIENNYN
jgi:GT2 family glycosyltransferase